MRYQMLVVGLVVAMAGCEGLQSRHTPPAHGLGGHLDMVGPSPGVAMYPPSMPMPSQASQVKFVGPEGMVVAWDISAPGLFDSEPLICPGRYNFPQAAIYRLRLSNIPSRPGVELYPTLEVGPAMPRTTAFLAHNTVPVQITEEDFDQVLSGNFVTKVIYLPDPEYQDLALAGVDTLVSTRLDPGVDPIEEADRRGSILAIVRIGNKDFRVPSDMGGGANGVVPATYSPGPPMAGGPANPMMVPSGYVPGVPSPQYAAPMFGDPNGAGAQMAPSRWADRR